MVRKSEENSYKVDIAEKFNSISMSQKDQDKRITRLEYAIDELRKELQNKNKYLQAVAILSLLTLISVTTGIDIQTLITQLASIIGL